MHDSQLQTEAVLLGAMILDGDLIHDCYIEPQELVTDDRHPLILEFLKYAAERDDVEKVDLVVLAEVAKERGGGLEKIGGIPYLQSLVSSVPSLVQFNFYQKSVRENYIERETKIRLNQISINVGNSDNINNHLNEVEAQVEELREMLPKTSSAGLMKASEVTKHHAVEIDRRSNLEGVIGANTVSKKIDEITNGHLEGKFEVVAARPSIGKTAHALNDIRVTCKDPTTAALFFSGEMGKVELIDRMISSLGNIDSKKMKTGKFDGDDWSRYQVALYQLDKMQFYIDDTVGMSIEYIRRTTRKEVKRLRAVGVTKIVIYVDYLQLVKTERKFKDRQAEVTYISGLSKVIARENACTVVALAQLSRGVEQRQDKRPMLSDLRESGSIEQDADIVSFLYRDDYYYKDSNKKNIMEIIIAKHRDGELGTVELYFLKKIGKLVDKDPKQEGAAK